MSKDNGARLAPPKPELGYAQVGWPAGRPEYVFRFHIGFPSSIWFRPPGCAKPVEIYRQTCVFEIPDHKVDHSLMIWGPDGMEVEVAVNCPRAGDVKSFEVDLRSREAATEGLCDDEEGKVKIKHGGRRVRRVRVIKRGETGFRALAGAAGGVEAFENDDGGTVTDNNEGETCPPDCLVRK